MFLSLYASLSVSKSTWNMCSPLHPYTYCNITYCRSKSYFMHACSQQPIQMQCRKTLWTMINGYLPLALEMKQRTVRLLWKGLETSTSIQKGFVLLSFRDLELSVWQQLWILTHPTLNKIAHCSMITPLTFSQTVTKTTSRGHTLLQGKICILRYCFLWKYTGDHLLWYLAFWVLFFCNAKHSNMSWLGVG